MSGGDSSPPFLEATPAVRGLTPAEPFTAVRSVLLAVAGRRSVALAVTGRSSFLTRVGLVNLNITVFSYAL